MKFLRRLAIFPVAVGIATALFLSDPLAAAAQVIQLAEIHGTVQDSSGAPLVGALVTASITVPSLHERMVLSDKRGSFFIPNLLAGQYSLKVSMPRFLPVQKNGIQLNGGAAANITVSLQTAMDVVRRATAARQRAQGEDIVWTLRSSRSTQPVLRLVQDPAAKESTPDNLPFDYSGYFRLYSQSVESATGTADSMGSQFSLTMPLQSQAKVTLTGQYNEAPDQPRGFGALYEFSPAVSHRSQIGVNVRQASGFGGPFESDSMKEVQVEYGEKFQWSDHIVLDYGAATGRSDAYVDRTYIRPRGSITWVPGPRTTISVGATAQAPAAADDPIRGKEYFDRSLHIPPALERYDHREVALSRLFSDDVKVAVAVFRDRTDSQALFVATPDGSRGLLIFNGRDMPSEGVRIHVNRQFRHFSAGVGYTNATGIGMDKNAQSLDDIQNHLKRTRFQVVTARFNTDVQLTNTEVTAVYRWISNFSAATIDPYQSVVEYNEPTLSLTIAQALPTWRMLPGKGKVQAIVDARNLFEQPFSAGPLQLAPSPRLVKGGINVRF